MVVVVVNAGGWRWYIGNGVSDGYDTGGSGNTGNSGIVCGGGSGHNKGQFRIPDF